MGQRRLYIVNFLFPFRKIIKPDDYVVERAKANASLWEARLEVTELSRIEYRDTSRRLAKCNEELKKQQYKMEKDTMSVLSFLKKQDQEKDNMKTMGKKRGEDEGTVGMKLRTFRKFLQPCHSFSILSLKESLRNSERKHQETLRRLEGRFFEEKHRLEQEAEKKIVMLAERAHHEAVVQLNTAGRNVFKENVYLHKALTYHLKEAEALQKSSLNLQESHSCLLHQKEVNDLLIKEKIVQLTQQRSQIQTLKKKVQNLENALTYMTTEFETEVLKLQQQAMIENQAGQVEIDKLQQLLQMKDKEMNRVKKLAKNILDERTEVEKFFLDALYDVKQQILISRKQYKQIAQSAFNVQMNRACAGKAEYPKIRTFDGREHSTNSVNQDLMEAEKWTLEEIASLYLLILTYYRKYSQSSKPPVPDYIASDSGEVKELRNDSKLPDPVFITQQIPILNPDETDS
uniref:Basal body-orientation factor 1 n=1 Tax=Jaculus jaculus TaxID=51337 RepID=A0A8C5NY51_JACJA